MKKKNIIVVCIFLIIVLLTVDFTAPVIEYNKWGANEHISTNEPFRIMVKVDEDEATCLFEQTSGPIVFVGDAGEPFIGTTTRSVSYEVCHLSRLKAKEPGERIFHVTVTGKSGRSSTLTIPITVAQEAPPRVCDNGEYEKKDSYGRKCCGGEMSYTYPTKGLGFTIPNQLGRATCIR